MFGTLGGPELFLIFVVALIVFGPRKLPEIGKSLGKMMAEFRKASNEFRSTIESEVEAEKIREAMRIEPPRVEPVTPTGTVPSGYSDPLATAPAAPAAEPPASPASESAVPPAESAVPPAAEPAPPPSTASVPTVPETVSQKPENTPIEPK